MASPNNKRKYSAQHRKDSARVLYTMMPSLPPPLVNLCLDYCFGPADDTSASGSGRLDEGDGMGDGPCRFRLRGMPDSKAMGGKCSLVAASNSDLGGGGSGFGSQPEKLVFDIDVKRLVS